mmetsp:Transcript_57440/g.130148  ORF Transcript_57440/g.130148 Transcript_57440/m.130148 type:complete len:214 (-) Transcript_57440:531-1172(-)
MAKSFWGPVTSSVDFCEENYALSRYVAEPANALSSLIIVAQGLVGVLFANARRGEVAIGVRSAWGNRLFATMYLLLAVIGLGSVALHTTLSQLGQAADEVISSPPQFHLCPSTLSQCLVHEPFGFVKCTDPNAPAQYLNHCHAFRSWLQAPKAFSAMDAFRRFCYIWSSCGYLRFFPKSVRSVCPHVPLDRCLDRRLDSDIGIPPPRAATCFF